MVTYYATMPHASIVEQEIGRINQKLDNLEVQSKLLQNNVNLRISAIEDKSSVNPCIIREIPKVDKLEEKIDYIEEKIDSVEKKIEKKSKLTKLLFLSRFI